MRTLKRRDFLQAGALTLGFLTSRLAFAHAGTSKSRFVFIIMRGALDGLAAVPPYGDPDYTGLRRELALAGPDSPGGALPLDGLFGLHPSLTFLREAYIARELVVFHAIASPYRERSHFDGQDVLENGSQVPHAVQTGWLNRALVSLQTEHTKELGVALGQNVPLVMRGPASVTSWSPSKLAALDEDTLERITDIYASDPTLSKRLADALAADAIAEGDVAATSGAGGMVMASNGGQTAAPEKRVTASARRMAAPTGMTVGGSGATSGASMDPSSPSRAIADSPRQRRKPAAYTEIVRAAAGFLRRDDGPQVAVFDTTGWDTHANEGTAEGQLAGRLAALDAGLRTLKEELGTVWADTAVVLATEFGRTAATNGTRGTDHGTGTVAFLLGGAVQGGRVVADWPGLSPRALYQGRDVKPTADLRALLKGVLAEHLLVSSRALEAAVFPDSGSARPMRGLFRV